MAKILVVDDSVDIVEIFTDFLTAKNHTVYSAYDGPEAVEKAIDIKPDLVLLDIQMPTMTGIEVCQTLRSREDTQLIPIVIVTGQYDDFTLMDAIKAGCDDFLSKPVNIPVLHARVESLLKMSRLRNQLREKERFEYMINNMSDGLVITDRDGIIQQCNTTAGQMFNLDPDNLPKEPFLEMIEKQFQKKELEWENLVEDKKGDFIAFRQEEDFKLNYALNITYTTIVNPFSDIDEIIFVSSEETERINEEYRKDLLQSMMRHKFNTMETITQLNLDSLGMLIDSPDPALETSIINGLKESARRLTTIMRSILDFLNLPESLRSEQKDQVTEDFLSEILESIKENLNTPDLEIQVDWNGIDSFEMVAGGLYRLLYEMIENAVKFGDQSDLGLSVTVSQRSGKSLDISVFNKGKKIPSSELDRLWTRFYQFDPEFTGQVEGVGLGLSVVKYIVESSGGSASAVSNNEGTNFRLSFPPDSLNVKFTP